jgi:hypothetical protein
MAYAEQVKNEVVLEFEKLPAQSYLAAKSLRKIVRMLDRDIRFTGSKQVDAELRLWFCDQFLDRINARTSYKPLATLFSRQAEKATKAIATLDPDLQHDYYSTFEQIRQKAEMKRHSLAGWLDRFRW